MMVFQYVTLCVYVYSLPIHYTASLLPALDPNFEVTKYCQHSIAATKHS